MRGGRLRPKYCFQSLIHLKGAKGSVLLQIGTIPARVGLGRLGPIVSIRLSQQSKRAGGWMWQNFATEFTIPDLIR